MAVSGRVTIPMFTCLVLRDIHLILGERESFAEFRVATLSIDPTGVNMSN